jgi:hypothetical protein
MTQKFRKRPIEIEALQWTGLNQREMWEFLGGGAGDYMTAYGENFYIDHRKVERGLVIKTSEGDMTASVNDYIIKEPFDKARKYYPCKPEVFELTYEEIK